MNLVADRLCFFGIIAGRACEAGAGRAKHGPGTRIGLGCHVVHAWPPVWPLNTGEGLTNVSVGDSEELIVDGAPHEDEAKKLGVFTRDWPT